MRWWQGAFASTSSSSKSHQQQQSSDDSFIKAAGFFSSRRNRLLNRARKLRQVTENDVDMWRGGSSPARVSAAEPQPLPLPELRLLLQRDPKFASCGGVPLPSPDPVQVMRGGDEREREREEIDGLNGLNRSSGLQDSRTNPEHSETRPSRKSRQNKHHTKGKSSESYNNIIPISAPTSPYSSLVLSPPRSDMWLSSSSHYLTPPGIFQAWSAPEMPHSDIINLGLGSSCLPERVYPSSVDNSPLQSPRMMAKDTSSHGAAPPAVHPLPLPPGAMAPQLISPVGVEFSGVNNIPSPISPVGNNNNNKQSEVVPIKCQWQKGKLIGRGTFGSVYVASNRETGALCAMKEVEILPDDSKSAECMRQLEQEIKVLSRLKHPNIVQYYGSEIVGDKFYIYLEYVHPGSINKFIQDHCGAITESVVRNFTRHILCGLAYLHSKKTIHRDIKGANLLVDAYGVVKLADFGMAKHLNGQTANLSLKGSPYWMAPELLQSSMQTDASCDIALAVDIWSLGCTIIEMMNGKPPWSEFEGPAALFKVLKETPPIPKTMSADGKNFLQCCFRRNPADRPTAAMLLDHPFVTYSHQPEASNQSLKETKLTDNKQFLRERPSHKLDQMPSSFDTHIKKGKLSNNNFMHDSSPVRVAGEVISKHPISFDS